MLAFSSAAIPRNALLLRRQQYAMLMASSLNQRILPPGSRCLPSSRSGASPCAKEYAVPAARRCGAIHHPRLHLEIPAHLWGRQGRQLLSINQMELGRTDIAPASMERVMSSGIPTALNALQRQHAFRHVHAQDPGRQLLAADHVPLTVDLGIAARAPANPESPCDRHLEITQDISTVRQRHCALPVAHPRHIPWISSTILFAILPVASSSAERTLAERMSRNRKLEAELHQNEKLASGRPRHRQHRPRISRNPLSIIGQAPVSHPAHARTGKTARPAPSLSAIFDESCRLGQIVNDFARLCPPRVPRQDRVDLNALLNQATGFLDGEMKRLGRCIRDTEGSCSSSSSGSAVPGRLQHSGQRLSGHRDQQVHPLSGERRDGSMIALSFHDSGPGFPPPCCTSFLIPSFTTKDRGTNSGLPS